MPTQQNQSIDLIIKSITDESIKNAIVVYLQHVADITKDNKNNPALEILLDHNHMIDFVGNKNSKYLAEFMKFLAITDSIAIKDKIMELIRSFR